MGSIVRLEYPLPLRLDLAHLFQHHQFQPRHLSLLNVPHARQNSNVHASRLSSPPLRPLPCRPRCSLHRLNRLPSRVRHERPQKAPTRPSMVHHQVLLRCTRPEARWILPASKKRFRLYRRHSVYRPAPNPPTHQLTFFPSIIFAAQLAFATFSLFPSPSHRASREAKRLARESRWAHLDSPTLESKVPAMSLNELANAPQTPNYNASSSSTSAAAALNPMTPRTLAFNRLGGTKDLPLRNHFTRSKDKEASTTSAPKSPNFSTRFALRSPTFPGSPLSPGFDRAERKVDEEMAVGSAATTAPVGPSGIQANAAAGSAGMYFPPPPKVAVKSGK
jgi:hypothetical protein